jgi:hypothetical protein
MPAYRIFHRKDGYLQRLPTVIDCATDGDAIRVAQQHVDGADMELFDGPRRVWWFSSQTKKR